MFVYLSMLDTPAQKAKFVDLYEAYRFTMLYTARRYVDESQAEDVVHDAFLRLAKIIDHVEPGTNVKTKSLCIIITKNIALDYLRKNKRLEPESEQDISTFMWNPTASLETKELFALIIKHISSLSEENKLVLQLRMIHEFRNDEVAAILAISPKAASARYRRSLLTLQKRILEEVSDENK